MQIKNSHLYSASKMVQNTFNASPKIEATNTIAKNNEPAALSATQTAKTHKGDSKGQSSNNSKLPFRAMRYAAYLAGSAYLYDKTANNFFLSTTSLHDGKCGFTSDARLNDAQDKARKRYQNNHSSTLENKGSLLSPLRLCGENQFLTMIDYRAATKEHLSNLVDTEQAHSSVLKNIMCLKGELTNDETIKKLNPEKIPKDFDLTNNEAYTSKNKYSLTGVRNEETGSTGYTSRSITKPFVEKGLKHFIEETHGEKALTPKQCMETLDNLLRKNITLNSDSQFAAGQALLVFRQVYAGEDTWGDAERVILKSHYNRGTVLQDEADKIELSRPFSEQDLAKGVFKRNTSIAGPALYHAYIYIQEKIFKLPPDKIEDLKHKSMADLKNLPLAHVKLIDSGVGFEDASGLGDSFTALNATSCVNHARIMSGEAPLSKDDVVILIGCLNAVYDNSSGIRHSLREIARGCFVGAGFTVQDGDDFYKQICKNASKQFYNG
ncbi:type III effector HopG1 [Pseudomonas syringae]|uniref:XopAG/AvrGf1 family type III secretion system effector n=1 Tax=Pseudomonas syringae TaxID=317 RepID=UPI00215A5138|nr:XopAG/AvrGf1 family type III secretion system effector [Pseudomonas syringae]MCR8719104.1 type III effector HopG1 [Pseudomonas syringae]